MDSTKEILKGYNRSDIDKIELNVYPDLLIDVLDNLQGLCKLLNFDHENFLLVTGFKELDESTVEKLSKQEIKNLEEGNKTKYSEEKIKELEITIAKNKAKTEALKKINKFTIDLAKHLFSEYDRENRKPGPELNKIINSIHLSTDIDKDILSKSDFRFLIGVFKKTLMDNQEELNQAFL